MPYVAPSTVVAGQTYSAAAHNVIVNDVIDHESRIVTATNQSVQVFTNEAARDAAITAPSEGMHAYLTAPTVPAATSPGYTALPSGITTVYNGSVWVCTTEVAAGEATADGDTTTSTSYVTSLTGDSSVTTSVTLVTGTSALINYGCNFYPAANLAARMSFSVSGATTVAATDADSVVVENGATNLQATAHSSRLLTGLTAGTNTFTLNYRVTGGTGTWTQRWLVVRGIA